MNSFIFLEPISSLFLSYTYQINLYHVVFCIRVLLAQRLGPPRPHDLDPLLLLIHTMPFNTALTRQLGIQGPLNYFFLKLRADKL